MRDEPTTSPEDRCAGEQQRAYEQWSRAAESSWMGQAARPSPGIRAWVEEWAYWLGEAERARLLEPLIARMPGTVSTVEVESQRGLLVIDWLLRVYTPAWLDLVPACTRDAARLRALQPIVDNETAASAGAVMRRVSARTTAAHAHARRAWLAAWDSTRPEAWDVAADAAWWAIQSTGASAASHAGRIAVADSAHLWARAAAMEAATIAAWRASWPAGSDAAWAALAPTVRAMQASAVGLVARMIAISGEGES